MWMNQWMIWLVLPLAFFYTPKNRFEDPQEDPLPFEEETDDPNMYLIGDNMDDVYNEIYENLNLTEVEYALSREGIGDDFPMKAMVENLVRGNTKDVTRKLSKGLYGELVAGLAKNKNLMLELIGIVLIGSIFVNLSSSFAGGFISENGFYITYLLVTSILLSSFSVALDIVVQAMDKVLVAVKVLVPTFVIAMRFVGQGTSATGMYTLIMLGIWLIQVVILRLVIPMIKFYVILSLVNNLQKEDSFSKLCDLVKSMVLWALRTIMVVVAGLNIIKGLLEPQIDALNNTAIKHLMSSVPNGVTSILTGTFLGAGMVIKNSIGIAGIVILSGICLLPFLQTFLLMFTVKITSAMVQPIGEKRFVDGISSLTQGISMLMQALASALVLFVLTIAMMVCAKGG